jgi:predicted RNA-binding Zn ribbon-like protein
MVENFSDVDRKFSEAEVKALQMKAGRILFRVCSDPKCGRLFPRAGKRRHCSLKCARRVYMRRYRARGRSTP